MQVKCATMSLSGRLRASILPFTIPFPRCASDSSIAENLLRIDFRRNWCLEKSIGDTITKPSLKILV